MPRKANGNGTTRSKKTTTSIQPAAVQVMPEITREVAKEVRTNGKPAAGRSVPANVEEEIRRRAYELYLQRRAVAGGGDENQDWLIAEREILSRSGSQQPHTS